MEGKPAERCQRESSETEKLFTHLMEIAPFSVAISRIHDGCYLLVNQAFCKNTGYTRDEVIGRTPAELNIYYDPADRDLLVREVKQKGHVEGFETKFKGKDGTIYCNKVTARAIHHQDRECMISITTFQSPPREVQGALIESKERFRNIVEGVAEGYYEVDLSGNLTFFNDAMVRISGYPPQELMGMNYRQYTPPEAAQKIFGVFNAIFKSGGSGKLVDYAIIRKDGTLRMVETSANLLRKGSGEPIGFYGILRDRTEEKKAEEALRKSEENYRSILENMEEGFFEVDLRGCYTFFNKALCRMHDCSPEELMGSSYRQYMSPQTIEKVFKAYNEVYRTGTPTQILDYEMIRKGGAIGILESSVVLLRDAAGNPTGFRGIVRDRTERKQAENALQESERNLRITLDSIGDAVIATDVQGKIVRMNPVAETLTGWPLQDAMGVHLSEVFRIIDEKSSAPIESPVEKVLRDRKIVGLGNHALLVARNGLQRPISDSAAPILTRSGDLAGVVLVFRDVAEKRKVEKALGEREEKYRSILEEMEEGYYETDLAGNFTYFNEATRKLHGYSESELLGMNYRQYAGPEMAKAIRRIFGKIHSTGLPARILDYEIIRKDGSVCMIEMSAYPLRDPAGQTIGFWGISRDRTERKRAEMALQESESKLRSIFDNAAVGIAYYTIHGEFIRINKAFCDLVGYTAVELSAIKAFELTHPDHRTAESRASDELLKGKDKSFTIEERLVKKDGSLLWGRITVSLALGDHDQPMFFIAVVEDISERKKAAEALQHSEERYRLLVENANEGIYITQQGRIKFFNPQFEQICRYPAAEMMGMPFVHLVHPDDKELLYEKPQRRLENQKLPGLFSFRIVNKDEEVLWVELSTVGITWEGQPASLNFLRDITPQKKIEAQLLQARKMEAIGTLAGGIAHDFNNLLMGIQGNASLALLDLKPYQQAQYEKLKNIEQYVKAGADLTKQLLGAAKGGKYEVRPSDLNKVIAVSSDLFGRTKKEITMHRKLQERLWPVEVDRGQIEQVLLNLYVNASHAMPQGGDLFLETQNVVLDQYYVQPYGVPPGKFCKISVTDTGVGIDARDQKRIFDPFFTTKSIGRGTGLGLASAYGIITNHGGIITVYSEKGSGTTFNIYLPATLKEVVEHEEPSTRVLNGHETILFVDDEKGIVDVARLILERLGYKVLTAQSGPEAVDIYNRHKDEIQLVILDMIMPGMSGSETFDALKAICPAIKVILSSGYSINGQAKGILDRGCRGFIQKPFGLKDLSIKLREILDRTECQTSPSIQDAAV